VSSLGLSLRAPRAWRSRWYGKGTDLDEGAPMLLVAVERTMLREVRGAKARAHRATDASSFRDFKPRREFARGLAAKVIESS